MFIKVINKLLKKSVVEYCGTFCQNVEKCYFYLILIFKLAVITFSNLYPVTVDDKGRVVLPSPFKKEMGDALETTFVVEKDVYDRCLNIYPYSTWLTKVEKLREKLNMDDPQHSKLLSRYYEEIAKIGMAENGRLNIPGEMLSYAGIRKEAVFTGQGSRMRLWEPERHQSSRLGDEEYVRLYKELLGA